MINLVKSKLLLFTIIFLFPFSNYSQEIISENVDLSDVQKNIKTLDEIYNEKLADISIKKKALYEAQIQVIKSKNSLILLNDLPLPNYEKYQILNDMALFLSDLNNVVDVEINPTLELIKKIDPQIQLTNNEENEFIEKIFIDVLSLEETIYSNFNNVQIDEYNELDNKIKDLSKILKETDKTNVDIDILIRKIENSENKKTKINSRLLIEDEKIFNLINEEKINSFDTIKFFIDLEDKNLVDPEIEIRKTIQATEDEIDDIKSNLNKSTSIISVNNKNLIKNYEALEKLYKSNRYNEYLIKDDGSLVLFNEEEEKIKNIISNLENEKSEYIKEINFLKTELELKNNKITEIFKESKEIKAEQKIVDAQINRMIVENNNLKSLLEQTNIIYSNNNQNLIEKYNELESLNNSNRVGKYFINEKGSMLSFKVEEKKIKDEIDLIESNAEILNQQIIDFNEKIKFQEKDINTTSKNRFSKVKELLKQKKLLYNLHRVEGTLKDKLLEANNDLQQARLEGDINKINKALKKKALSTSKLQIARAEIAISKNKEKRKFLSYNKDINLSNTNLNDDDKKIILRKYNVSSKRIDFFNKKINTSLVASVNKNKLKQSEEMLIAELNEADKELKEARLEGDINKINKALKKKAFTTSKLQIARAEIAISKNKEKSRIIEFDRDLKLSTPLLNLEERKKVHNQYTFSIGQLNLEYNILKNKIRNSINERKLEQNKIDYIAATNQLNELIKEGNETKINKAKERLTLIEKGFNETKNEIKKIKLNQISEINKIKKNNPLDKIKDFSKKDNQENKMKSVTKEKVFLKSGQVFSNDYSAVFNGPSPKEKKALLKRIKKGSSKNINVMSNNLLILNGTDLIVIPLKDILGQTDEKLNSVITAAFDPKKSLSEIRDSISEEVKFDTERENKYNEKDKNNSKSNNGEINNNEFQVSELRSTFKNNFKEVVKAEKEKNEAEKVANKAAKELQQAKKELEEIKSKLNEEAYKKALAVLEDAKKILSEKNDILKALIEKASKEAAEHATAQINVASTKVIKDNAFNDLILAESFADAREIAKQAAQKKLDDISGKTAFNNALNSGHSLALATQEIEKTIREAATNAGLPIAIINAGIAAQGSAFNQALEEGLSLQDAFNAAMDAGAKITEFENYKLTAKNDLNVKTAALNTALSEVDAKEAILDKAQKDLNLAKEISVNEGKESIQASLAKDNANNEFNSAKENKSKAEQDVIEKKKLCSTCK